jgi:predicted ATPase/DNA-binding CsgD family transcriptional regulator
MTPLINRERELAAVQASLRAREVRLLTLTGAGGVGKTRLASEVASSLASEFADGVHFVPLAGVRDPDSVAPTIARTLGIREAGDRPIAEVLVDELSHRDVLVILDNFEQVDAAAPLLSDLLAAGSGLHMVVTSRSVLRITGEHQFPILPLPFPDLKNLPQLMEIAATPAVRLFVERARAATGNFTLTAANARDVVAICARLDGLPLAIQLAAARLRHMPLPVIADRLGRSLSLLVGGPRDSPERQQALRATIDWSYELLSSAEQALFRRLAVFVGGWTLEAAEGVVAGSDDQNLEVLDGVSVLVDNSLVVQTPGSDSHPRYGMLETIREFGIEQLHLSGEKELTEQSHTTYFLSMGIQASEMIDGRDQAVWLRRLSIDYENIRSVLERSIELKDANTALLLGVSLWGFWSQRGLLREGRLTLEQALQVDGDIEPTVRGRAIFCLGLLALDLSDLAAANAYLADSLKIWRELEDENRIAAVSLGLGVVARNMGNYRQAVEHFEESLAVLSAANDASGMASALLGLGTVAVAEGAYEQARSLQEQSLAIRRQLENVDDIAYALYELATVARLRGDIVSADIQYQESLELFRELGDRLGQGYIAHGQAKMAQLRGDDIEALQLFRDALTLHQSLGARDWMVACIEGIAIVMVSRGHIEPAVRLLGATGPLREKAVTTPTLAEREELKRALTLARRTLTDAAFADAWAIGQSLTLEQATAEALLLTETREVLSRPSSPFNLTRREQEVLVLLCQHLTDPEIAARLYLSTRTASNHVANILSKLGVDNRREAIAFATKHGLV